MDRGIISNVKFNDVLYSYDFFVLIGFFYVIICLIHAFCVIVW